MPRLGVLLLMIMAVVPASARAAEPGPRMVIAQSERLDALACAGSLAHAPQTPVLLVHGTGVTARENWSFGYQKVLQDKGHGVCTVQLPDRGFGDVQRSLEYVVTAIREMHRRAARPISVIGHSQGAVLPPLALRIWPDLAPMVDDVVGLSGAYTGDHLHLCQATCLPAFWQLQGTGRFWSATQRHPLPAGPSYTAIGTLYDEIVNPQPQVNALPPGPDRTSVLIQDLCPGRSVPKGYNHIYMAADAIAYDLAADALGHAGPADPAHVPPQDCAKQVLDGFDAPGFAAIAPGLLAAPAGEGVAGEPPMRCYLVPRCALLRTVRLAPAVIRGRGACRARCGRPTAARLRIRSADNGELTIRVLRGVRGRRRTVCSRGPFAIIGATRTVTITSGICGHAGTASRRRTLTAGRYVIELRTRHLPDDPWAGEGRRHLTVVAP